MSSGSTGTWSRNSSISCAVVPTTNGTAGSDACTGGLDSRSSSTQGWNGIMPTFASAACDRLLLRVEQRGDREVAERRHAGNPGGVEELFPHPLDRGDVERRRGRAALEDRARHGHVARREQMGEAPAPADSPMSTIRSGSPPNRRRCRAHPLDRGAQVAEPEVEGTPSAASHPSAPSR